MGISFNRLKSALLFILICSTMLAQKNLVNEEAKKIIKDAERIVIRKNSTAPSFIVLAKSSTVLESAHLDWLQKEALKSTHEISFLLTKKEIDPAGYTHYRYQQHYNDIKVEQGVYYIHCKNGKVVSANGEFHEIPTGTSTKSKLNYNQALQYANKSFKSNASTICTSEKDKTLRIINVKNKNHLCYKIELYSSNPLKKSAQYIDAINGKTIFEEEKIHTGDVTGTAHTAYSGTQTITFDEVSANNYRLRESVRGINTLNCNSGGFQDTVDFTNTGLVWTAATHTEKSAFDLHYGLEKTYDYFQSNYSRNSFDNAGAPIYGYAHFGNNYNNAFWDGTRFVFGDGNGFSYQSFTSTEIVGHEFTHAVTEFSAGLIYMNESGALNESFSDIFGVVIDYYANPDSANFLQGEKAKLSGPMRDMTNPNNTSQPDTYNGLHWVLPGGWDNGGVHTNSQVQNYWFYLLCNGGAGTNDINNAFSVTGIGMSDAAKIAYRNLTVYLTPNSTFEDARTFAIQSATDLFGVCSQQVIQCTNAWQAVGVGAAFDNTVVADFYASNTYSCVSPATISFFNTSTNDVIYNWSFGDGGTSTLENPSHTYTTTGVYNVSLTVNGSGICNYQDSKLITGYINVTNNNILPAACSPNQLSTVNTLGITRVELANLNNNSLDATEGNKDFTCTHLANMVAGSPYELKVKTVNTSSERSYAWIDYNNDGNFDNATELVMAHTGGNTHNQLIQTNINAILNTPLRMRIKDQKLIAPITDACQNNFGGQTEDYAVMFTANTQAPLANFFAVPRLASVNTTIQFTDSTLNAPTGWYWEFEGGTPAVSSLQNPLVQYSATGLYKVKLTASNGFGTDSIIKVSYVNIVGMHSMCSTSSTYNASGILYDSGGPNGNYDEFENCSFTIYPGCAQSITLTIDSLNTEMNNDYIIIYDGINTTGSMIGYFEGNIAGSSITATSGAMHIVFTSNYNNNFPGFKASWTSVLTGTTTVVADYSISNTNPPLSTSVIFTDQSLNTPVGWTWDFGDGTFSFDRHPTHIYSTPGAKTVTLITTNCSSSDTISKTIVVQAAPDISVSPSSLNLNLDCGDTLSVPITIYNNGAGDLVYSGGYSQNDSVKILSCIAAIDTAGYLYKNTINSIDQQFSRYQLSYYSGTSATTLETQLNGIDVVLFPFHEFGNTNYYYDYAPLLQNYVSNGGIIIFCRGGVSDRLFSTGMFNGYVMSNVNGNFLSVVNSTDSITKDLNNPYFLAPSDVDAYYITNSDVVPLIKYDSLDVVFYRNIGRGKAICIGADFWEVSPEFSKMIAAAVRSKYNQKISIQPAPFFVQPGDSMNCVVSIIRSEGSGNFSDVYNLVSNDTLETLTINYTVNGSPSILITQSCIHYGEVAQNTSVTELLSITNFGCDTLTITSISNTNAAFTYPASSLLIAPGITKNLSVTFHPTALASYSDTLLIISNDIPQEICLSGYGVTPPQLSISQDSIYVSLSACHASQNVNIMLSNTGGLALNYETNAFAAGQPRKILAYINGADLGGEYANTIAALNSNFTNYQLSTFNTGTPSDLISALTDIDVLLFPEIETYWPGTLLPHSGVIQNFVNSGGSVIFCAPSISLLNDVGLLLSNAGAWNPPGLVQVNDTTHPINKNVPLIFSSDATPYYTFTETGITELCSTYGSTIVANKQYGSGQAILVAFDYDSYNLNTARLLSNAITWEEETSLPSWLVTSPAIGNIPASSSSQLSLSFNSSLYTAGTYTCNLFINSTDLFSPDTIICVMEIGSNPCIDFSHSNLGDCNAVVSFNDSIVNNANNIVWNFGDGTSSTTNNPLHTYQNTGTYTVTLIGCNGTYCDTSSHPITINGINGPIAPFCKPQTIDDCCGLGIYNVTLNSINKSSDGGSDGYMDYSCNEITYLNTETPYLLKVTTSSDQVEEISAWIDYDNNGQFSFSEMLFYVNDITGLYQKLITIPDGIIQDTPLRLRIISDFSFDPINSCNNLYYGQCEDYSIVAVSSIVPPASSFHVLSNDTCTGLVSFKNTSAGAIGTLLWDFGDSDTSTAQHPTHIYSQPGTYTVTLTNSNNFGTTSYTQTITTSPLTFEINISGSPILNEQLYFNLNTSSLLNCMWNFGDGDSSSLMNPTHIYSTAGTYIISSTITSGNCTNTIYSSITIYGDDKNAQLDLLNNITIAPNPFQNSLSFNFKGSGQIGINVDVTDILGQTLISSATLVIGQNEQQQLDTSLLTEGVYFIRIRMKNVYKTIKLVKTGN